MKKTVLLVLIFMVILLPSCNLPEKVTEDMMRTIVASTLQAKINMIGSMTPPTKPEGRPTARPSAWV